MKPFNTSQWDKRNVWTTPSGEMCVRPALVSFGGSNTVRGMPAFVHAKNPRTDESLYYAVQVNDTDTWVLMMDEDFNTLFQYTISSTTPSKAASIVVMGDEVGVWSPDWPALWGVVGGSLQEATSVTSINDVNTKTLDNIPTGIAVFWAGRVVVCQDNRLFFSDGQAMRTFVGANAVDPPGGFVYGLHVSQDGYLFLVTSTGVWRIPETAAMSGQIVLGVFEKVTDYECTGYNKSCVSRGRVVGLTTRGVQFIDEPSGKEITLSDKVMSRSAQYGRMNFSDYRDGIIVPTDWGVIVSVSRFSYWLDMVRGVGSWMSLSRADAYGNLYTYAYVGSPSGYPVIRTVVGTYVVGGNRHDLEDSEDAGGECFASIAGRMFAPPSSSPRIRSVAFASDTLFTMKAAINGKIRSATPPQVYPVDGDNWNNGIWREPPQRSRDFPFAEKGDEVTCECIVEGHPSTMPSTIDVEFGGLGLRRPNR